jgi:hypothetical protein
VVKKLLTRRGRPYPLGVMLNLFQHPFSGRAVDIVKMDPEFRVTEREAIA